MAFLSRLSPFVVEQGVGTNRVTISGGVLSAGAEVVEADVAFVPSPSNSCMAKGEGWGILNVFDFFS